MHRKSAERVKAMEASKRDEDASNKKYTHGLMAQELAPISVGALMNNVSKGAKFTDDLDKRQRNRSNDPIVKKAVGDTQQRFPKLFEHVRNMAAAATEFVQAVQQAAGRYQAIDEKTLDSFNANMKEAATRCRHAHEAVDAANFGAGWAQMVLGLARLNNAGTDASMLNLRAISDAEQMEGLLRFVQSECKLVLCVLGAAGTGVGEAARGGDRRRGERDRAVFGDGTLQHPSELTVGSILAGTLIDLAGLWMGENFTGFVSNKARQAVEDLMGTAPPGFKDKAMAELQPLLFGHVKSVLSQASDQYLGKHGKRITQPKPSSSRNANSL